MLFERDISHCTKPWPHRRQEEGRDSQHQGVTKLCQRSPKQNSQAKKFLPTQARGNL